MFKQVFSAAVYVVVCAVATITGFVSPSHASPGTLAQPAFKAYEARVASADRALADGLILQFKRPPNPSVPVSNLVVSLLQQTGLFPAINQVTARPMGVANTYAVSLATLPTTLSQQQFSTLINRLSALPEVASVVADAPVHLMERTPNDSFYKTQSRYLSRSSSGVGIGASTAWMTSTGAGSQIIAVIDTGVLYDHPDLQGRLLPGYDFISDVGSAGDGDARDANAADPGDGTTAAYLRGKGGACARVQPADSSWHGTAVSGTIAAQTNNGIGVAGINWQASILPVRVVGKCGGVLSDLIDGMLWASGLNVPGAPANPTPASILNLSLGATASCSTVLQTAVDDIRAKGIIVVAAAGNENSSVTAPGNCKGALAIASVNYNGSKASYSNYGSQVTWSAPVGSTVEESVLTTSNDGKVDPANHSYAYYAGTSFATPMSVGVLSLVAAANPGWTADQVINRVVSTVAPFSKVTGLQSCESFSLLRGQECNCTRNSCGAGVLNAAAAIPAGALTTGEAMSSGGSSSPSAANGTSSTTPATTNASEVTSSPTVSSSGGSSGGGGALSVYVLAFFAFSMALLRRSKTAF